jgi:hypothetical protein
MPGTNDKRTPASSLRPSHVRSAALAAAVVGVVVLPIAAAQATPSHPAKQASVTGTPATGAPATATALLPQYCGSTESGFQGQVSAQSCVDDTDGSVTGEVYVTNSTGSPLTVAINLTRTDRSIAQMVCTVAAHQQDATCVTGALQASAGTGAFDAIAELVPVGAPVATGVLHADSGQVAQVASGSDTAGQAADGASGDATGATPSVSASPAA